MKFIHFSSNTKYDLSKRDRPLGSCYMLVKTWAVAKVVTGKLPGSLFRSRHNSAGSSEFQQFFPNDRGSVF